jgi:hypothetical protein
MKFVIGIALIVLCVVSPAHAQTGESETLFSGRIEHGGYGGPVLKTGSIRDQTALLVGGYGGWFINHTFMIGGGGYGLVNDISAAGEAKKINGYTPSVGFGYGGLVLEFTGNSNSLVHYTVHTLIGAGGAGHYLRNFDADTAGDKTLREEWTGCFVSELGAAVELNVASFFRLALGAGYLFVNGVDLPGLSDSDLSSPTGFLMLKFGKF